MCEALTVVPGNTTGQQALQNALRSWRWLAGATFPWPAGAVRPLAQKLITAEFVHGRNGLGDIPLSVTPCKADPRFGPDLIIEMVRKSPGQITLVPIGPLTNIALAVLKDPGIVPLVKDVVLMGGSITEGNVTAVAEANIYNDPEAAQVVFTAGWPVTMVGLDVTHRTLFGQNHLAELKAGHGPATILRPRSWRSWSQLAAKFGSTGTPMHDPLAVGVAIDPTLVTGREMRVDVETRGEFTRGADGGQPERRRRAQCGPGRSTGDVGIDRVKPNTKVAVEVDADRFLKSLFIERLAASSSRIAADAKAGGRHANGWSQLAGGCAAVAGGRRRADAGSR